MVTRRQLLAGMLATPFAAFVHAIEGAAAMQFGYAGITWGNDYRAAIDEIAAVGYRGVQLRAGDGLLDEFGDRPAALRELLAQKRLAFPVFSSGNLSIDPMREHEMIDLHVKHARFVRDAGGLFLQVIDERPKGRAIGADDYRRTGRLLTELGKRVQDVGVTLAYHHHLNSTGEKPEEVAAVLDAADRGHVRLLFDTAHYLQGGGDPAAAIRTHREWIAVLHLKDVRAASAQPGRYQFVELGRGRVDLPAVFAALNEIDFKGWAVVELDRVPDPGRSPKECAEINRRYLVDTLHRTL